MELQINLNKLKEKYNLILATEKKAEEFFNSPQESLDRKMLWLPKFNLIIRKLSTLMVTYQHLTGEAMTEEEMFNGFKL